MYDDDAEFEMWCYKQHLEDLEEQRRKREYLAMSERHSCECVIYKFRKIPQLISVAVITKDTINFLYLYDEEGVMETSLKGNNLVLKDVKQALNFINSYAKWYVYGLNKMLPPFKYMYIDWFNNQVGTSEVPICFVSSDIINPRGDKNREAALQLLKETFEEDEGSLKAGNAHLQNEEFEFMEYHKDISSLYAFSIINIDNKIF